MGENIYNSAWYQRHGYSADPLTIKPDTRLIARDEELKVIAQHLMSGNIALIQADAGLGKTSILKALKENFDKHNEYKAHLVSLPSGLEEIKKLNRREGLLDSMLLWMGFRKRKNIVLIDEAQTMMYNQGEFLKNLYDSDHIHSIVLVSNDRNSLNISTSFKRRIGEHISLPKLSVSQLRKLLDTRLNGSRLLHDETVEYLAKAAEGNPREFLILCKKVCIKVNEFMQGEYGISTDEVRGIIGNKATNGFNEKAKVVDEENCIENLTRLQKTIIEQLLMHSMSLDELSMATGSSIGTVGKQISILSLKAKKEYMARKGIREALISKDKDNIKTIYSLTEYARKICNGAGNGEQ